MCFSPQADLVVGGVVGAIGIDSLRHVTRTREVPLAALPLVFGAHQIIESGVWAGLSGTIPDEWGRAATYAYLVIAFVLPIVAPLAIAAAEPVAARARPMAALAVLGMIPAGVLLVAVLRGPVSASVGGHFLAYEVEVPAGGVLVALYVIATCGAPLLSSHRRLVVFGALHAVAVGVLATLTRRGFISLWCAWAAVISVMIDIHLRDHRREPDAALPGGPPVRPRPRTEAPTDSRR